MSYNILVLTNSNAMMAVVMAVVVVTDDDNNDDGGEGKWEGEEDEEKTELVEY
jgi:hypothetical protein